MKKHLDFVKSPTLAMCLNVGIVCGAWGSYYQGDTTAMIFILSGNLLAVSSFIVGLTQVEVKILSSSSGDTSKAKPYFYTSLGLIVVTTVLGIYFPYSFASKTENQIETVFGYKKDDVSLSNFYLENISLKNSINDIENAKKLPDIQSNDRYNVTLPLIHLNF